MRYIMAALTAALILGYGSTPGHTYDIYVLSWGMHSCGKYLAAAHGHRPGVSVGFNDPVEGQLSDAHSRYMAWLTGFLSATNAWVTQEPNGIHDDDAAIDVWIRKWCEQNPTKSLADAAQTFVIDQRNEHLLKWFAKQPR